MPYLVPKYQKYGEIHSYSHLKRGLGGFSLNASSAEYASLLQRLRLDNVFMPGRLCLYLILTVHFTNNRWLWSLRRGGIALNCKNPVLSFVVFTIFFCLICGLASAGEWTVVRNPAWQSDFTDVSFVDPQTGWVVGHGGAILHTTNGGKTWTAQQAGDTYDLEAVQFVDQQCHFRS